MRHVARGQCSSCYGAAHRAQPVRGTRVGGRLPKEPLYVDDVAVERAIAGYPVSLNLAELAEAIQILNRKNFTVRDIAEMLGCSERTVERHRARLRTGA